MRSLNWIWLRVAGVYLESCSPVSLATGPGIEVSFDASMNSTNKRKHDCSIQITTQNLIKVYMLSGFIGTQSSLRYISTMLVNTRPKTQLYNMQYLIACNHFVVCIRLFMMEWWVLGYPLRIGHIFIKILTPHYMYRIYASFGVHIHLVTLRSRLHPGHRNQLCCLPMNLKKSSLFS